MLLKHHNPNPCIIVVTKDYKVEMDNDHWNYWSSIHLVYLIIYIFLIWNVILMSWLASLLKTRGSTTWGRYVFIYICWLFPPQTHHSVPNLPLCLGVLKHRASSSCRNFYYDGFLLVWRNFKFEGVLFRSDSRHND